MKALLLAALTAGVMVVLDLVGSRTFLRDSTGLAPRPVNAFSFDRILRKLLGFAATLAALRAAYLLLPEYAGDFYAPAWNAAREILPWILVAAPAYIVYVDRRQRDPEDAYADLGGLLMARPLTADWGKLGQHVRGWLVKGFFLPLMFVYLVGTLEYVLTADVGAALTSFRGFYELSYNAIFVIDLLFAVIGYLLTLRLLDTHIRSTEPTMTGWVVCLACYQPFWSLVERLYLQHEQDGVGWGDAVAGYPVLYVAWGSTILLCLVVYGLATVMFGLRFSNLTHRGIITSGPYRWSKHPAYVSKCTAFWLMSVPFINGAGWTVSLQSSLLLLGITLIYYLRAKTEERHLRFDPVYRDYEAYIAEYGLFAKARRLVSATA